MKQDGSVPQISFFKIKHIKGFWPFVVNTDEEVPELAVSWSFLSSTYQNLLNSFFHNLTLPSWLFWNSDTIAFLERLKKIGKQWAVFL